MLVINEATTANNILTTLSSAAGIVNGVEYSTFNGEEVTYFETNYDGKGYAEITSKIIVNGESADLSITIPSLEKGFHDLSQLDDLYSIVLTSNEGYYTHDQSLQNTVEIVSNINGTVTFKISATLKNYKDQPLEIAGEFVAREQSFLDIF